MRTWRYRPVTEWSVQLGDELLAVDVEFPGGDGITCSVGGRKLHVALAWQPGQKLAKATIDGRFLVTQVDPLLEGYLLSHGGAELKVLLRTRKAAEYYEHSSGHLPEPMRKDEEKEYGATKKGAKREK